MISRVRLAVAAATVTGITLVPTMLFAATASAEPSADAKRLCEKNCGITTSIGASKDGVDEGGSIKANVQGKPGTYKARAFMITEEKGKKAIVPVGPVTTVTVGENGYAFDQQFKIDQIKAPHTGGVDRFTIQMADAKDASQLITGGSKVNTFTVNSHRAQATPKGGSVPTGHTGTISLDAGMPGDRYEALMKTKDGQWKKVSSDGKGAGMAWPNGEINDKHYGLLHYDPVKVESAAGKYQVKVVNVKAPNDPVLTFDITIGGGEPGKTATPKGTATPKSTATPKGTATPTGPSTPKADTRAESKFVGKDGSGRAQYYFDEQGNLVSEGKLVDAHGRPIPGVKIYSRYDGLGGKPITIGETTTGSDGGFHLVGRIPSDIPEGTGTTFHLSFDGNDVYKPVTMTTTEATPKRGTGPGGDSKDAKGIPRGLDTPVEREGGLAKTGE